MKESKDRTEQFMYSSATAANQAPNNSKLALDFESADGGMSPHNGGGRGAFQQIELVEQRICPFP
jgi:syntaxin 5